MREWTDFDYITMVTLPLFLFSATFYPITAYPEALRVIVSLTPLYQGVELLRSLTTGAVGPWIVGNVVYLVVMGLIGLTIASKRLDKLLLK
jgi:lipooligosaccharide transport system permease protein